MKTATMMTTPTTSTTLAEAVALADKTEALASKSVEEIKAAQAAEQAAIAEQQAREKKSQMVIDLKLKIDRRAHEIEATERGRVRATELLTRAQTDADERIASYLLVLDRHAPQFGVLTAATEAAHSRLVHSRAALYRAQQNLAGIETRLATMRMEQQRERKLIEAVFTQAA